MIASKFNLEILIIVIMAISSKTVSCQLELRAVKIIGETVNYSLREFTYILL